MFNQTTTMLNTKNDIKIMEMLGVSEIRHHFAETSKGNLVAMLRKGEDNYIFCLDAVPVEKEINTNLIEFYGGVTK